MSNSTTVTLDASDATATALSATIRAEVNGLGKYAAYVSAHNVTADTVNAHAKALAAFTYPNEKRVLTRQVEGKTVRTKYGNAVQKISAGLKYALGKGEAKTPTVAIRASLKGVGTVTITPEDARFADLARALFGDEVDLSDFTVETAAPVLTVA